MRVIAQLPDKTHFRPILGTDRWPYIWQAIASDRLQVYSKVPNPWNKVWEINVKEQPAKSARGHRTIGRIDLQCHAVESLNRWKHALLKLDFQWDKILHSKCYSLRFYAIPTGGKQTLTLSVIETEQARIEVVDKQANAPKKQNVPFVENQQGQRSSTIATAGAVEVNHHTKERVEESISTAQQTVKAPSPEIVKVGWKKANAPPKQIPTEAVEVNQGRSNDERREASIEWVRAAVGSLRQTLPDYASLKVKQKMRLIQAEVRKSRGTGISSQTLYQPWIKALWMEN